MKKNRIQNLKIFSYFMRGKRNKKIYFSLFLMKFIEKKNTTRETLIFEYKKNKFFFFDKNQKKIFFSKEILLELKQTSF